MAFAARPTGVGRQRTTRTPRKYRLRSISFDDSIPSPWVFAAPGKTTSITHPFDLTRHYAWHESC